MALCEFSKLFCGPCSGSTDYPSNVACISIGECDRDVKGHLKFCKISGDIAAKSESRLLLARAVMRFSDPSDKDFCQECDHQHDGRCSQCDALDNVLVHIENLVHSAEFHNKEDKDEACYLCRTSVNAIHSWKSHQLRSVHQDQARIDAINALEEHSALIVSDWAVKFIPQRYKESQQDWFGKRGMSWHIAVVFRQIEGTLQLQSFVHLMQSSTQDSLTVVHIWQHILKAIKDEDEMRSRHLSISYPK
ncbi:hypothetical protein AWC38_SpisGene10801 [Stylophora pistillata]|uniref:Uncharacterized protein n=1 Tax=Stylophora pistillata TaxID=50429 RepID=A0A2B4S1N2_STYPI|nr:hypothetical protein AWC38_SpisGene10801 [Stylophora pistillata]